MQLLVELRYVVPPLVNLTLWVLIIPLSKHWAQDTNFNNDIFVMACLSLAISILLIFLFTSVKLPLSVEPVQLRAGDFSAPLTLSLLASIFFPSTLFWFVFPMLLMLVILSPWCAMLLHAIPAPIITRITQRPQVELEAIVIEAGNNEANII